MKLRGGTKRTSKSSDNNDFTTPILTIPSKGPGNCFVHGFLINTPVSFLVDTGADVTVVRSDIWDGAEGGELDVWKGTERLVDASGNLMRVMGTKVASIRLGGEGEFTHPVIVVDKLPMEALLGMDFILQNGCILDPAAGKIRVRSKPGMTLPLQSNVPRCDAAKLCTTACVSLKETIKIPPLHEVEVNGTFTGELEPGPWLRESSGVPKRTVHVANAIVIPRNGMVTMRLMNSSCEPVTVYHGDLIARMELLKSSEVVTIGCLSTEESLQSTDTHTPQITPEKEKKLWEIVQGMQNSVHKRGRGCLIC